MKTKAIQIKNCPKTTQDLYKKLKDHCDKAGWKLKVKAPMALELGIKEMLEEKTND